MKRTLIAALFVAVPFAASAADGDLKGSCSMKADKLTKKSELMAMAKVKPAEATKVELEVATGSKVVKGGIATEDGCVISSYHVAHSDKSQTAVFIAAGNG